MESYKTFLFDWFLKGSCSYPLKEIELGYGSGIFDFKINMFVIWVIEGIRACFAGNSSIFDIFGNVVEAWSEENEFQFYIFFLVELQTQMMLGDSFPVKIIGGAFLELDDQVDIFNIE